MKSSGNHRVLIWICDYHNTSSWYLLIDLVDYHYESDSDSGSDTQLTSYSSELELVITY